MIEPSKPGEGVTVKDVLATHNRGSSQRLVDRRHLDIMIIMFTMTMRMWRKNIRYEKDQIHDGDEDDLLNRPGDEGSACVSNRLAAASAEGGLWKNMIVIIVVVVLINEYNVK